MAFIIKAVLTLLFFGWLFLVQRMITGSYQKGDPSPDTASADEELDTEEAALRIAKKNMQKAQTAHTKAVKSKSPDDDVPAKEAFDAATAAYNAQLKRTDEARARAKEVHASSDTVASIHFNFSDIARSFLAIPGKLKDLWNWWVHNVWNFWVINIWSKTPFGWSFRF